MGRYVAIGAAAGAVFFVASVAAASDGALEISSACTATGCFAGDTPGLPVQTQAGKRYVLTSDLVVPSANTDGINLATSATLDLNGFSLAGPVTCTGTPAVCVGSGNGIGIITGAGSTVRDGAVRGMGSTGVQTTGKAVLIENLFIEQNAGSGIRGSSDGSIIRGCRVFGNGISGIALAFGSGSPGSLVTGNAVSGNGSDGISGAAILVQGNSISGNKLFGLSLNFAADNVGYTQNVITNNNARDIPHAPPVAC